MIRSLLIQPRCLELLNHSNLLIIKSYGEEIWLNFSLWLNLVSSLVWLHAVLGIYAAWCPISLHDYASASGSQLCTMDQNEESVTLPSPVPGSLLSLSVPHPSLSLFFLPFIYSQSFYHILWFPSQFLLLFSCNHLSPSPPLYFLYALFPLFSDLPSTLPSFPPSLITEMKNKQKLLQLQKMNQQPQQPKKALPRNRPRMRTRTSKKTRSS